MSPQQKIQAPKQADVPTPPLTEPSQSDRMADSRWNAVLFTLVCFGAIAVLAYALSADTNEPSPNPGIGLQLSQFGLLGTSALIALASLVLGGLTGFLFGIPRVLANKGDTDPSGATETNTNLEQISDWLTKILVGVGLTQLTVLPDELWSLAGMLAEGVGAGPFARVFVLAELLYFAPIGFLWAYLYTRIFLREEIERSHLRLQRYRQEEIAAVVTAIASTQSDADSRLIAALEMQLDPPRDALPPSDKQLQDLIAAASNEGRDKALRMARTVRRDTWRDDKEKMERTIPIFRFLLETDQFHDSHIVRGQLAFALKDKRPPDWQEAARLFKRAIEIREANNENGWSYYELGLTTCYIKLDSDFDRRAASKPNTKAKIDKLIGTMLELPTMHAVIADTIIPDWCKLNNVELPRAATP